MMLNLNFGEANCLLKREQFATDLRRQTKSKILNDRRKRLQGDSTDN